MADVDTPAVVFKKRSRTTGNAAARRDMAPSSNPVASTATEHEPEASTSGTSGVAGSSGTIAGQTTEAGQGDDDDEGTATNLAELIALRRLKQSTQKAGIDLEKLNSINREQAKKRKKRKAAEEAANNGEPQYGLVNRKSKMAAGGGGGGDGDSDNEDPNDAITRKIMKTDNFTHQTGIVDVDKHMMAYIERELKKRRGQATDADFDAEREMQALDPHDELFKVAEKYRIDKGEIKEGNVATSAAMLTAIPEIDLGIDIRLRNIEATEKAKKKLQEARARAAATAATSGQFDDYYDANYAGSRFFRHTRGNQTDFDAIRAAKIEAGVSEDEEDEKYEAEMEKFFAAERKKGRGEMATDDIVAERFKRAGLLQPRGRR